MQKDNILKSSEFHMDKGDILHLLLLDENYSGDPTIIDLGGIDNERVPDQPVANAATGITSGGFTANWNFMENSTGYYLDVATDSAFTSMMAGYDNYPAGNTITKAIAGLRPYFAYYYRVRAYNHIGLSINSDTIFVRTLALHANDWYLPSKDELNEMHLQLCYIDGYGDVQNLGGFVLVTIYSTSSENNATNVWGQIFPPGAQSSVIPKSELNAVRACRSFTSVSPSYSLRDYGPSGGYIFYKNGDDYLEAAPTDQSIYQAWSNIINVEIGVTAQGTAIGTGQANTIAIIGQAGHTSSAAKLCNDLIT
jgi:hypothetical protein